MVLMLKNISPILQALSISYVLCVLPDFYMEQYVVRNGTHASSLDMSLYNSHLPPRKFQPAIMPTPLFPTHDNEDSD